jgi:hypothetical protein
MEKVATLKMTKKKWGRFSKWFLTTQPLMEWKKWFTNRGKECELRCVNSRWALFVNQEWAVE